MPISLRIFLILGSLVANIYIVNRVGKSKLNMSEAVYWVSLAICIMIIALFPHLIYKLSDVTGTLSPANLVYLLIIAVLLLKVFTMSLKISHLENKIENLVREISLKENKFIDKK